MSAEQELSELRRVLVVAQASGAGGGSLDTARTLAAMLGAELAGLFVEDLNLLRMAALPVTREIGAISGAVRPLDVADVERALRLQAGRLERTLAEWGSQSALPWSFRVGRGELVQQVLAELSKSVAAVIAPARVRAVSGQARPGTVLSVFDAGEGGARALALGLRLVQTAGALHVAIAAASEAQFRAGQLAASAHASVPSRPLQFLQLQRVEPADLLHAVHATGASALLLSTRSAEITPHRLKALLDHIDCSLVLLH